MRAYTGVGSREAPESALRLLERLGATLAARGFVLRSGAADGADTAFQNGWLSWLGEAYGPWPKFGGTRAQIFIPWNGFQNLRSGDLFGSVYIPSDIHFAVEMKAEAIARQTHPNWAACSQGAKKLHTRNVYQVLGPHLTEPSAFLVCWAKTDRQGNIKGGTATAWNLARAHNIPCFNLNVEADRLRIERFLE